jgi:MFS family permease
VALLLIAAIIGVISPSGYEVGPFLPVEQAALSQIVPELHTKVFAWYNLVGSFATATGALCGGGLTQLLQQVGLTALNSYRTVVVLYGIMGVLLAVLCTRLSPLVEVVHFDDPKTPSHFGLHRSGGIVLKLLPYSVWTLLPAASLFKAWSLTGFMFASVSNPQPSEASFSERTFSRGFLPWALHR